MTARRLAPILCLCVFAAPIRARAAPPKDEPLAESVRRAIDDGVAFLKKKQEDRGRGEKNWENSAGGIIFSGGPTTLTMLALLTAGVSYKDPVIQNAMPYMRKIPRADTYVVGLQTMVLSEIVQAMGQEREPPKEMLVLRQEIQGNVDWLWKARYINKNKLAGWSYKTGATGTSDNSNSQYAMLGLWAGRQAGAKVEDAVWREILEFYRTTQNNEDTDSAGWGYNPNRDTNTLTMTSAGVCGLFIAGREVNADQQKLDAKTGVAAACGVYAEDKNVKLGMRWLAERFSFRTTQSSFYNIYGLERVGRLSGQRFIGERDWYREGCELLTGVKGQGGFAQRLDGSWSLPQGGLVDGDSVLGTSFALLFLSKGRTPILLSKLAYGPVVADDATPNWNRKHNDARHLVEYASKELFRSKHLAWQVFDPRRSQLDKEQTFDEELAALVQSPILYITGHDAPRMTDQQKKLLRRYVEEGGFIMAEACCGSKNFAEGFRSLMGDIFADYPLEKLPPEHPIWSAHTPVRPTEFPQLEGMEMGCKTVVVFSPEPLAGYWEDARFLPKDLTAVTRDRGDMAFRLAGNVIAYATGLEPPKPRLTVDKLLSNKDERKLPRHALKIGQLKHTGDWSPAPQATRQLASYLRDKFKLEVALDREPVRLAETDASLYKLLYMHGRNKFTFDPEDQDNIRNALKLGSVVLADACCGKKEFDAAFRDFANGLIKDVKLVPIPPDDLLFGAELNGTAISKVRLRERAGEKYEDGAPKLEGLKLNGRWVVIYSRYDIGCALENHKSSACLGYDRESAQRLAAASMLYALKP